MINIQLAIYAHAFATHTEILFKAFNLAYFNEEEYVEVGLE